MIHKFIINVKNIDKKILKIMFLGFKISFFICLFSTLILSLYNINPISHIYYEFGLKLFQTSITFAICFFSFGLFTDNLRKI